MRRVRARVGVWAAVSAAFLIIMYGTPGHSEEFRYGLGVSPSFSTGDYGMGDDVDVLYLPLVFKYYPSEKAWFSVSVPWIYQSSTQVVSAGGMFHRVTGMNNIDNRRMGPGSMMTAGDAPGAKDSESGLGDIFVRGSYELLSEPLHGFDLILEGNVKLPTASESRGLGTGELDLGGAAELGRTLGGIYYFGRVGYTALGEPSGADFDNPFLYEGGMGFEATPELYMTLSLEGRTSIDNTVDNPLEAVLSGDYALRPDLSLTGYLLVGLSDGSPDVGLGLGLLQKF